MYTQLYASGSDHLMSRRYMRLALIILYIMELGSNSGIGCDSVDWHAIELRDVGCLARALSRDRLARSIRLICPRKRTERPSGDKAQSRPLSTRITLTRSIDSERWRRIMPGRYAPSIPAARTVGPWRGVQHGAAVRCGALCLASYLGFVKNTYLRTVLYYLSQFTALFSQCV
jgi:hypothetical protein